MSVTLGLALILAALLFGRAAKIGSRMQPVPWWLSDNMSAGLVAPGLVTLMVLGVGVFVTAAANQGLGALAFRSLVGMAACVAVFVVLWRMLSAWSRRVEAAVAPVVEPVARAAAQNDPTQPPGVPPLKKAA